MIAEALARLLSTSALAGTRASLVLFAIALAFGRLIASVVALAFAFVWLASALEALLVWLT